MVAYLHDAGDAAHVTLQQRESLGEFLQHAYLALGQFLGDFLGDLRVIRAAIGSSDAERMS